jgi:hypothetical protein
MQIRLVGKLCLGLAACLALDAFSTDARADVLCDICRANIILKNRTTIFGFFEIYELPKQYETGTEILDFLKSSRVSKLTVYRKLQTIRYPKRLVFAAAREDTVEVLTSDIRTIDYLSKMDCVLGMEPSGHTSLPQKAIDLLQKAPFALVDIPITETMDEVCLSYSRQIGKAELRRLCGKIQEIEFNPKLTDREREARRKRRFDGLFTRGIIAIRFEEFL